MHFVPVTCASAHLQIDKVGQIHAALALAQGTAACVLRSWHSVLHMLLLLLLLLHLLLLLLPLLLSASIAC